MSLLCLSPRAVKEEPRDEEEEPKAKAPPRAARKSPGLPKDVSVAELLRELSLTKEEELLFLQLPDTLPGQPPTQDIKPVKTEVQGEDGQMVLIKQEKDRVRLRQDSGETWGCGPGKGAALWGQSRCAILATTHAAHSQPQQGPKAACFRPQVPIGVPAF